MIENLNKTKESQMANDCAEMKPESPQCAGETGVHIAGVTGSSPVSPTTTHKKNQWVKPRAIQGPEAQAYHIARARAVFAYEPSEGRLYRRSTGKPAGRISDSGYRVVCMDGIEWRAHRIIWAWAYGEVPTEDEEIDHINGDRADNRLENLRKASRLQNQWNAKIRKDNTSGFKGVSWNKKSRRWTANISISGKVVYLGTFDTPEAARDTYEAKAKELRGVFSPSQTERVTG